MIPVRCFTCGNVISRFWEEYKRQVEKEQEKPQKVLDDLGVERYCCRRMLLSHVEMIDIFSQYY